MKKPIAIALMLVSTTACSTTPDVPQNIVTTKIPYSAPENPVDRRTYVPENPETSNPSLWATSPTALLSFGRAKDVGDLLTVIVEMDDQASLQNSLSRSRSSNENLEIEAFLGLPEWAATFLPGGSSLSPAIDFGRDSDLQGAGSVNRAEQVEFRLASRVVGVEQNGNLIIQGYQQTRISNEVRYLTVSGVIRVQDITRGNTIAYDKIADAQISYISTGAATGGVQPGFVPKVLDKVNPF